jgi:hypothetical protein
MPHLGYKVILVSCIFVATLVAYIPQTMASGRAKCPGAKDPGFEGVGIIATKSNDFEGDVYARGATQCTIKFRDPHKTAPYCKVSGVKVYHISGKVLRASPSEVTFTFHPPLTDQPFSYECAFRD